MVFDIVIAQREASVGSVGWFPQCNGWAEGLRKVGVAGTTLGEANVGWFLQCNGSAEVVRAHKERFL